MKTTKKQNTNAGHKKVAVKPLGDRVLIKEEMEKGAERITASGIIIPDSANGDRGAKRGTVVAVGEGKYEDGKLIPMRVAVGDTVLFQWGDTVKIGDEEYHMVNESNILGIIK